MENKKSTKFWMVSLVLTAFLIGGLAQSPAFAADHTIKVVFLGNTEDEDYDGSMVFKDFCESRSNGAIEVQIYPGGQLCGNPRECLEALQAGIIEVYMTTLGGFGNMFPEIQVWTCPTCSMMIGLLKLYLPDHFSMNCARPLLEEPVCV